MYDVLKSKTEEVTIRELTAAELNEVAGGNPFSFSTFNFPNFNIGSVQGDFSTFNNTFGAVAGQVNNF